METPYSRWPFNFTINLFVMSYISKNLINGENIVYTTKYHWIIFISLKSLLTLFIGPLLHFLYDEFTITNKRVVVKTGIISRKTTEMNLSRIESVNIDQSILARILGYGSITLIGTGGTREIFHRISRPLEFRKQFQQLI